MSTDVATIEKTELSPWQVAPAQTAKYAGLARHHRRAFDDYETAKLHILQAVGDIEQMQVFGRRVLLAVFCKPNIRTMKKHDGSETMWIEPLKAIKEDWWQGKAAMILKIGPDAFNGDESWIEANFGAAGRPKVFDWVFANASAGFQMSVEDDETASRPQGVDMHGNTIDIYDWGGWPCRLVDDTEIFGRLLNPQLVV